MLPHASSSFDPVRSTSPMAESNIPDIGNLSRQPGNDRFAQSGTGISHEYPIPAASTTTGRLGDKNSGARRAAPIATRDNFDPLDRVNLIDFCGRRCALCMMPAPPEKLTLEHILQAASKSGGELVSGSLPHIDNLTLTTYRSIASPRNFLLFWPG